MMSVIWASLAAVSVIFGMVSGRMDAVASAVTDGCASAVQLMLSLGGMICFWAGIMEVMSASGLADKISAGLRPLIRLIFGKAGEDRKASQYISANMTANLMGLSNASTHLGLKAAERINELTGGGETASDTLIRLVVLNTASLQLIPTTVAALRATLGAAAPYDIIIPVWVSSAISVTAGLLCAKLLEGRGRHR